MPGWLQQPLAERKAVAHYAYSVLFSTQRSRKQLLSLYTNFSFWKHSLIFQDFFFFFREIWFCFINVTWVIWTVEQWRKLAIRYAIWLIIHNWFFFPLIYPVLVISNVAFYIPHNIWALSFRIVHGLRGISFVSFLFMGIKDWTHRLSLVVHFIQILTGPVSVDIYLFYSVDTAGIGLVHRASEIVAFIYIHQSSSFQTLLYDSFLFWFLDCHMS